ncbi:carbonic anhydrase 2 isoform X5 [Zootermopsis nevadensis]|uniref:carbonic anhydrase 2 isoform X5 n=1 Tax=Zootermopsis nevadensis TaxID=136037 RepID=UPI000B8E5FB2|nr:carbonic anhydrase 2 isoform X5 [Zootermopsis nevadensis]
MSVDVAHAKSIRTCEPGTFVCTAILTLQSDIANQIPSSFSTVFSSNNRGKAFLLSRLNRSTSSFLPVEGSGWTYKEGGNGPDEWPGMCQVGARQSPVDLDPKTAVPGHFESLVLLNYDRKTVGNVTNNGHTLMLTFEQPCEMVMAAGGLPAVYRLEQIHFHWRSEHTFQGKRCPLEMHMVHYDRQFKKLGDAVKFNQGLAVLAVLFYVAQFHKVQSHHEPLTSNFRPIQTVNKRQIYLQQPSERYQEISAASSVYESCFIVIVLSTFSITH